MTDKPRKTGAEILKTRRPLRYEDHWVDEWGSMVRIRELTAGQRDDLSLLWKRTREDGRSIHYLAKLVQLSAVTEDGRPVFSEGQVPELAADSARVINRLADVAERLSGMAPASVEEAAKNSEATETDSND